LPRFYSFDNEVPYRRYRFSVTGSGGAGVQLAELQLFGPGSPVFSVDDSVTGSEVHQFEYSEGWIDHTTLDTEVVPLKYGLSSSWNRHPGDFTTFRFSGSQIRLYGVTHLQHGLAAISIDGGAETLVDFYGPLAGDVLLYVSPTLCPPTAHSLRVRTTGEKSPGSRDAYVSLDRAKVIP
jgi:hypothetical protein